MESDHELLKARIVSRAYKLQKTGLELHRVFSPAKRPLMFEAGGYVLVGKETGYLFEGDALVVYPCWEDNGNGSITAIGYIRASAVEIVTHQVA